MCQLGRLNPNPLSMQPHVQLKDVYMLMRSVSFIYDLSAETSHK